MILKINLSIFICCPFEITKLKHENIIDTDVIFKDLSLLLGSTKVLKYQ